MGLTGGIGAGKSSVAQVLQSFGAAVIDSDELSHAELRDPDVMATLVRWWGDRILQADGSINRRGVADVVFDDAAELARLEGLLYPRLAKRRDELIKFYFANARVNAIVLDAPKLYEAGVDKCCDAVIYVDADQGTRFERLASSRGWTEEECTRRENALKPLDNKKAIADYVVGNHSSVGDLRHEVERVFASVLADFS